MAITPQHATAKAGYPEEALIQLEARIDQMIVNNIRAGGHAAVIDASIFDSTLQRTLIMERYEQAGWNVSYDSDQRDGDYVTIMPNNTPSRTPRRRASQKSNYSPEDESQSRPRHWQDYVV